MHKLCQSHFSLSRPMHALPEMLDTLVYPMHLSDSVYARPIFVEVWARDRRDCLRAEAK
jgi:hypothetical protein